MPAAVQLPVAERARALAALAPFDRLAEAERLLLAEVVEVRDFAPAEIAHAGSALLPSLWIIVAGQLLDPAGRPVAPLQGLPDLLLFTITPALTAGRAGARVFSLGQGYFFTLTRECPEFTLGLLESRPSSPARP